MSPLARAYSLISLISSMFLEMRELIISQLFDHLDEEMLLTNFAAFAVSSSPLFAKRVFLNIKIETYVVV